MKLPVSLKIALLTVAATAFYSYVGQLVPQKEVIPPQETEMKADMTQEEMLEIGRDLMENKGMCSTCHTIGKSGPLRFPDLAGIGGRAGSRIPGMNDVQYLAHSLYEPNEFIVPGFNPGMPVINKPPIGLTDQEILAVIAYLQSLGGTVTVNMQTRLEYMEGSPPSGMETTAAPPPAAGAPVPPEVSASPVPTTAETGDALLTRFGCDGCHRLNQPGRLRAASLYDAGSRLNRAALLGALVSDGEAHRDAAFRAEATLADLQRIVSVLDSKKGQP